MHLHSGGPVKFSVALRTEESVTRPRARAVDMAWDNPEFGQTADAASRGHRGDDPARPPQPKSESDRATARQSR
jgi:hypothetical protein